MADLEFVQFHPTALLPARRAQEDADGARLPLLTEALRGAGAILLNEAGERFMVRDHPLAELAPRDVVARSIARRTAAGQAVFLDLRPALARAGEGAFPQALAASRRAGYDPLAEPVPITPAAHYHMGGVLTDPDGRTGLVGLWACGEVACTGVHGANRLASNSLLEGLVFGARVADSIRRGGGGGTLVAAPVVPPLSACRPEAMATPEAVAAARNRLREIMSQHVGLVRSGEGLERAIHDLDALDADLEVATSGHGSRRSADAPFSAAVTWAEVRNMLLVARLVARTALARTESRGAHYRIDHPQPDPQWRRRQVVGVDFLARAPSVVAAPPLATSVR